MSDNYGKPFNPAREQLLQKNSTEPLNLMDTKPPVSNMGDLISQPRPGKILVSLKQCEERVYEVQTYTIELKTR